MVHEPTEQGSSLLRKYSIVDELEASNSQEPEPEQVELPGHLATSRQFNSQETPAGAPTYTLALNADDRAELILRRILTLSKRSKTDPNEINMLEFSQFIQRGVDTEEINIDEKKLLFTTLARDNATRNEKISSIDVHQLASLVERGLWHQRWETYCDEVKWRSIKHGASGPALATIATLLNDPMQDSPHVSIAQNLGLPYAYCCCLLHIFLIPLFLPFATLLRRTRLMLFLTRLILPRRLATVRSGLVGILPVLFVILPLWILGLIVCAYYFGHRPEYLFDDTITPLILSFLLASKISAVQSSVENQLNVDFVLGQSKAMNTQRNNLFIGGPPELPDNTCGILPICPSGEANLHKTPKNTGSSRRVTTKSRLSGVDQDLSTTTNLQSSHYETDPAALPHLSSERPKPQARRKSMKPIPQKDKSTVSLPPDTAQQSMESVSQFTVHDSDTHRAGSRSTHSKYTAAAKQITESYVATQIVQRADDYMKHSTLFGARNTKRVHIAMFFSAVLFATIPVLWRSQHNLPIYGGAEKVNYCVERWLPSMVLSVTGLSACPNQKFTTVESQQLSNSTLYTDDLFSVVYDHGNIGTTAGHTITVGAIVWSIIVFYFMLKYVHWLASRTYKHVLHWHMFSALTNPGQATLLNLPQVSLQHNWHAWYRLRFYVTSFRSVELVWAEQGILHMLLCIFFSWVVTLWHAYLAFVSKLHHGNSIEIRFMLLATICSGVLVFLSLMGHRLHTLRQQGIGLLWEEKWRAVLSSQNIRCDVHRERAELEKALDHLIKLIQVGQAYTPIQFCGLNCGSHFIFIAYIVFGMSIAGLILTICVDTEGGPQEDISNSALKVLAEANFGYSHAFSQAILQDLHTLEHNLSHIQFAVDLGNTLVASLDNDLPQRTHNLVEELVKCANCSYPPNSTTLFPHWGQVHAEATYGQMMRLAFNKLGKYTDYCPLDDGLPREAWCDATSTA